MQHEPSTTPASRGTGEWSRPTRWVDHRGTVRQTAPHPWSGSTGPRTEERHMGQIVHTYPEPDLIEHDTEGPDCVCGVTIEPIHCPDGSYGWHILHHSLDGREQREAHAG
jgi:hypothetical protein